MNGTDIRSTSPRILPFSSIGGSERRICQVLALADGAVLALQATCVSGSAPVVTVFSALRPAGGDWSVAAPLALDLAVPAALSMTVPPVLLRDGPDFAVAWAMDGAGLIVLTQGGAELVEGPGRITALCAEAGRIYAAVGAEIFARQPGQGWQRFAPALAGGEVTALGFFAGQMHAAVANAVAGFDLWRSAGGDWTQVMTRGAWRYGSSPKVTAMAAAGGRLYVAADGPDISHVRVGDEHPEILAVAADGSWQLLSGQARFSPEGLRLPTTAGGPGVPACCGLSVGGMQMQGETLLVWLKPRGKGANVLSLLRLSASGWSAPDRFALVELAVTSLAVAADDTVLVASGAETDGASTRKPLLVARAPH